MAHRILILTDREIGAIRAAMRTLAESEAMGPAAISIFNRAFRKVDAAPEFSAVGWSDLQRAAGEVLDAGGVEDLQAVFGNGNGAARASTCRAAINQALKQK